ncbi:conjugal transfer protein TraH [Thermodesulfovibrio sp. 1176]|uniref:conjugal transfer protein TraH n=1 Tax=Thermodesulfovibrio sp. 1176 TaxID=3043424 RepID=UPI002482D202|nr:conjugal transfer protein TraH [Thermodesulfovibrio sp. 1176]MDI1472967.1 conjugal transfer protein TraH [Thermodesulfovibrio sp. 1176]
MALIKNITAIILVVSLIFPPFAYSGWLDNWFDQQVSSGPNYFEGQKRGYFTAGSFSARIPSSTDYLFSIEAPRLKAGCGGIDAFLGGFGFTNFDYLVQKFQRLIQAAPIVAFQIALNTLSAQLEGIVGKAEDIINALNSIQLNECAMMKPFTTINLAKNDVGKQFTDAAEAAIKTTGLTDLYNSITAKGASATTKTNQTPSPSEQYAGCGTELQGIIDNSGDNKGVIGYIAQIGGYDSLAPLIRGMIGDLVIKAGPSTIYGSLTPSCEENAFGAFKEGKLFKRDTPFTQGCQSDSVQSFRDKVSQYLIDANLKLKTKQHLTTEMENMFKVSPLPVYNFIKYSSMTGDTSILPAMADPVAKGMLYQAFLDVYINLYKILGKMEAVSYKTNGSDPDKLCNIEHIREKMLQLIARAQTFYEYARSTYAAALEENKTTVEIAFTYKNFEDYVYKQLSERFSSSLAQKVLGR